MNAVTEPKTASPGALRQRIAELESRLEAVCRQEEALRAALDELRSRLPEAEPHADPVLRECARDVVRVLRSAGRPLTPLQILDEMAGRHLTWREGTVRHVLADLAAEGVVREGGEDRPRGFQLIQEL